MSIETAEGMENSEFALSEEEIAELEQQRKIEEGEVKEEDEEVDQEFLQKLLNGEGEENNNAGAGANKATETEENNANQNNNDANQGNNQQQQQQADTDYQEHLANEAALNDWQEKLNEASTAKQELLDELKAIGKKVDDGEIGEGEYEAEKERIKDLIQSQNKVISRAETGLEQAEQVYQDHLAKRDQSATQDWYNELKSFVQLNPAYDLNAQDQRYVTRFDELIAELSEKQAFVGLNHKQIIQTVQHRVEMELGAPEKQAQSKDEKPKGAPKRQEVNIPPTMTQMQIAEPNQQGDEFAMLNRLDGLEYEAALEKLEKNNPQAYKRYLSQMT